MLWQFSKRSIHRFAHRYDLGISLPWQYWDRFQVVFFLWFYRGKPVKGLSRCLWWFVWQRCLSCCSRWIELLRVEPIQPFDRNLDRSIWSEPFPVVSHLQSIFSDFQGSHHEWALDETCLIHLLGHWPQDLRFLSWQMLVMPSFFGRGAQHLEQLDFGHQL